MFCCIAAILVTSAKQCNNTLLFTSFAQQSSFYIHMFFTLQIQNMVHEVGEKFT